MNNAGGTSIEPPAEFVFWAPHAEANQVGLQSHIPGHPSRHVVCRHSGHALLEPPAVVSLQSVGICEGMVVLGGSVRSLNGEEQLLHFFSPARWDSSEKLSFGSGQLSVWNNDHNLENNSSKITSIN